MRKTILAAAICAAAQVPLVAACPNFLRAVEIRFSGLSDEEQARVHKEQRQIYVKSAGSRYDRYQALLAGMADREAKKPDIDKAYDRCEISSAQHNHLLAVLAKRPDVELSILYLRVELEDDNERLEARIIDLERAAAPPAAAKP